GEAAAAASPVPDARTGALPLTGGHRALPHGARRPHGSGRSSYGVPMMMYAVSLPGTSGSGRPRPATAGLRELPTGSARTAGGGT
ncbi:hypothetical protein, partial [Streptomyces sp. NPDC059651]|uniref:hypothetical protein n=1 Tax=Streptomyces sp. NPDC059651 TaxID=3346897 RepID=UPI003687E9D3